MLQPTLSKKNTLIIDNLIRDNNINCIIEYGSGNSTLYYLNNIVNRPLTFISIENDKKWFYYLIDKMKSSTYSLDVKKWSHKEHLKFFNQPPVSPYTPIKEGFSKFTIWLERFNYGPFFNLRKFKFFCPFFEIY